MVMKSGRYIIYVVYLLNPHSRVASFLKIPGCKLIYNNSQAGTHSTVIGFISNYIVGIVYYKYYIGTMSTETSTKINQLLNSSPTGIVFTSKWLTKLGYSLDLQKRYRRGNWLESIGSGAMIRKGDIVDYTGAIYAFQHQLGLSIHPGGRTSIALQGRTHYLEFLENKTLMGFPGEKLPSWWKAQTQWAKSSTYNTSSFLPNDIGMIDLELKTYSIKVSGLARAILECIYLAPKTYEILECYTLMQGLNNLRPNTVQELLEHCGSIKVKRLFLYLANKAGHSWLEYIDLSKIDLGKGKRALVKNGIYIKEYMITVPIELEDEQL